MMCDPWNTRNNPYPHVCLCVCVRVCVCVSLPSRICQSTRYTLHEISHGHKYTAFTAHTCAHVCVCVCVCVCVRLRDAPREAQVALLESINSRGDLFLIHTEVSGQYTIRLAIGSATTQVRKSTHTHTHTHTHAALPDDAMQSIFGTLVCTGIQVLWIASCAL